MPGLRLEYSDEFFQQCIFLITSAGAISAIRNSPMFIRLILLFTLLPLAELFILLKVGSMIGLLNTIILVIGTATLGAYLAKRQGIETLNRIRQQLEHGALPAEELIDGLLILIAAIVLITPGLLTDTFGFLLLIPQTRRWLKRYVQEFFKNRIARGSMWVYKK
jgi:UPF0716 protein FxsA